VDLALVPEGGPAGEASCRISFRAAEASTAGDDEEELVLSRRVGAEHTAGLQMDGDGRAGCPGA
jgi:hypothetical protein